MKTLYFLIFLVFSISLSAQTEISNLSELQKIYFISETNGLTGNTVNPAALGIRNNDDGLLLSYDFMDKPDQGNKLVSLSMGNLGFVYQDIDNLGNLNLSSYAFNLSVGGDFLSIGSTNKIINIDYGDYNKSYFIINLGAIIQPVSFVSIAFTANNIGNSSIDSVKYDQIYTLGGRIAVFKFIDLFIQSDFKDSSELNTNVQTSVGFSLTPLKFLEFRGWLKGTKNLVNEGILSAGLKIENGVIITSSVHINSEREKMRYNLMMALPLKTISF